MPSEAFFTPRKALRMNDEGIEVLYQPAAHSNADSFVLFRASDVVVTGDVMDMTSFPVIDLANGGTIQGEIDALNRLIDLTIAPTPFIYKDVGTYVVPGHGRVCEQMEVVDYRDMVVARARRRRRPDEAGQDARSRSRPRARRCPTKRDTVRKRPRTRSSKRCTRA